MGMGFGGAYGDYIRRVRMRMQHLDEYERVHKSTSDLLREQQDEEEQRNAPPPPPEEDAAVQGTKPHKAAQWDEKRACWVLWDKRRSEWVPYP